MSTLTNIGKVSLGITLLSSVALATQAQAANQHNASDYKRLSNIVGLQKPFLGIEDNISFAGQETIKIDRAVSIDGTKDSGRSAVLTGGKVSQAQLNQLAAAKIRMEKQISRATVALEKALASASKKSERRSLRKDYKKLVAQLKSDYNNLEKVTKAGVIERAFDITAEGVNLSNLTIKSFASKENGGAILANKNSIFDIRNILFKKNTSEQNGGALSNSGGYSSTGITSYVSDSIFKKNKANYGGAVQNAGMLALYNSRFVKNIAELGGGAINNASGAHLTVYDALFKKNVAKNGKGGAINNGGTAYVFDSTLNKNKAVYGGAINNQENAYTEVKGSSLAKNKASENGGAIQNAGTMVVYDTLFANNKAKLAGGAINNINDLTVRASQFINNTAKKGSGGAINNRDGASLLVNNSYFEGNTSKRGNGGAVNNDSDSTAYIANTSFYNNAATKGNGGAIANAGKLSIAAHATDVVFEGNTANGESNAIHNFASGELRLLASAGNKIVFNDSITGNGVIEINNDKHDGKIKINADMSQYAGEVNLNNGVLKVGKKVGFDTDGYTNMFDNLNVYGGKLNSVNGIMDRFDATNWNTFSTLDVVVDVDMSLAQADYFDNLDAENSLNIKRLNILNGIENVYQQSIEIADVSNGATISYSGKSQVDSGIFMYDVDSSMVGSTGALSFTSTGYSPTSYKTNVAGRAHAGTSVNILNDAVAPGSRQSLAMGQLASGDYFRNPFVSAWVESYASSEDLNLDGLKVDNDSYYTIVGGDIKGKDLGAWSSLFSIYTGYTGSDQKYDDVKIDQDGVIFGAGLTLEKDVYYSALSANIAISSVDSQSSIGKDKFDLYSFSIANKVGAELKVVDSILEFEPSLMLGYHHIYTEDYTNAAGNKIESDGLNVFTIAPELKLKAVFENGFTPYVAVSYNWNLEEGGDVTADNILVPNLSVDNYTEFKVGTEAVFGDNLSGFVELQATSGDREGYGAQIGAKWHF